MKRRAEGAKHGGQRVLGERMPRLISAVVGGWFRLSESARQPDGVKRAGSAEATGAGSSGAQERRIAVSAFPTHPLAESAREQRRGRSLPAKRIIQTPAAILLSVRGTALGSTFSAFLD
jgi:hypothetical protein